jgi:hypothetical protein
MNRAPIAASFGARPEAGSGAGCAQAIDAAKKKGSHPAALLGCELERGRITSPR